MLEHFRGRLQWVCAVIRRRFSGGFKVHPSANEWRLSRNTTGYNGSKAAVRVPRAC